MVTLNKPLILASGSARRQKMLRDLGWKFEIRLSQIDETFDPKLSPEENVTNLARQKASAVAYQIKRDALVLGADTTVVLDGEVLNKPVDADDARAMLNRLSGKTHNVFTGFSLFDFTSGLIFSDYEATAVTFRRLSRQEIEEYVKSGACMDKAGAYGIQGDISATFAERIDGCFYNVVGLPLSRVYTAIGDFQEKPEFNKRSI